MEKDCSACAEFGGQSAKNWLHPRAKCRNAELGGARQQHTADTYAKTKIMKRIDEVLGDVVKRDPKKTVSPAKRP